MEDLSLAERAEFYRRMAHATYDIAERCDDPDMLKAYLDLAGKWLAMAAAAEQPR